MKNFAMTLIITAVLFFQANFAFAAVRVMPTLIELNANKSRGNYLTTAFSVQADKGGNSQV